MLEYFDMSFSVKEVEQFIPKSILQRGKSYISRVKQDTVILKPFSVKVEVRGSKIYFVKISRPSQKQFSYSKYLVDCTCPYGDVCKHIVAVAYVLEANKNWLNCLDNGVVENQSNDDVWLEKLNQIIEKKQKINYGSTDSNKNYFSAVAYVLTPFVNKDDINAADEIDDEDYYDKYKPMHERLNSLIIRAHKFKIDKKNEDAEIRLNKNHTSPKTLLNKNSNCLLTETDEEILSLMKVIKKDGFISDYGYFYDLSVLEKPLLSKFINLFSKSPYVFLDNADGRRSKINFSKDKPFLFVKGNINEDGLNWKTKLELDGKILDEKIVNFFDYYPALILTDKKNIYQLGNKNTVEHLELITKSSLLTKDSLKNPDVINSLVNISQNLPLILPEEWSIGAKIYDPIPMLSLQIEKSLWKIDIRFKYQNREFLPSDNVENNFLFLLKTSNTTTEFVRRNLTKEQEYTKEISDYLGTEIETKMPMYFVPEQKNILDLLKNLSINWEIWIDKSQKPVSRNKAEIDIKTGYGIDWLEISGELKIDDQKIKIIDILDEVLHEQGMLKVNGQLHLLSEENLEALKKLSNIYDKKSKKFRLNKTKLGLVEDYEEFIDKDKLSEQWKNNLTKLKNFDGIKKAKTTKSFDAKLRDYQQYGLNWLHFLRECNFGGILADDMGLGKTIQALALLSYSHEKLKQHKMSLIVAPTSVVYNWEQEIKKFAPNLKSCIFVGNGRKLPEKNTTDILITSYALLYRDIELLEKIDFHYVVLDEAQYIKNSTSKTFKSACKLESDHRLSLTGTPLENNLSELWSQFNFVNEGMFDSEDSFNLNFKKPIEKYDDQDAKDCLKKIIKPFFLRRTKQAVLKDLPEKIEETMWCKMEKQQQDLYQNIKEYYQAKVFKLVEEKGLEKSQIEILEALLRLRQVCCHPKLLGLENKKSKFKLPDNLKNISSSVKTDNTLELIKSVISEGHKILLFSQFTSMIDIIESELKKLNIKTLVLTGQTKNVERQALIKEFQENEQPCVFLLSLKAGGTGLNLTSASYVIHYDPWWNPAVEAQATDRAHRIGQKQVVNVYKMLVKDSIEEKILTLQEKKKSMIDDLITGNNKSKRLSKKDLEYLFQ